MLKERSNGRIEMRVAGSAQLGNDAAMLTALRTGTLDMSANSQGASSAALPELAALGLPFLFPNAAKAYKVLDGPIGEELAETLRDGRAGRARWWDNGIRHITNSKRPIAKPEDLQGLKIRTPPDPMTIDIFQALGAATAADQLRRALRRAAAGRRRRPGEPARPTSSVQALRGEQVHLADRPQVGVLPLPHVADRVGTPVRSRPRLIIEAAAKEAGGLQRKLLAESDEKLLAEFKANPAVAVNEVDQAPSGRPRPAVVDNWQAQAFGDFVKQLRAAAARKVDEPSNSSPLGTAPGRKVFRYAARRARRDRSHRSPVGCRMACCCSPASR